jgi:hypothetical protein
MVFWGTMLLVATALFLRKSFLFFNPQFWAEDGVVFFHQMHEQGWKSFFITYAGYSHLAPRLIAAFSSLFDPLYAPALYFWSSAFLNLAAAASVFSKRLDLPCRPLFALAFVLVPHTGEVWLTVTNLQWLFAPGILLLLMARDPETPLQWAFDLIMLTLVGLTGPFIVIWLPLFAWRIWKRRYSRASLWLGLIALVTAGIQVYGLLQFKEPPPEGPILLDHLIRLPGMRMWGSLLLKMSVAEKLSTVACVLMAVVGWSGASWLALTPLDKRETRFTLLLAGLILMASAFLKSRHNLGHFDIIAAGDRYFYMPKLFMLWVFIFELASPALWRRSIAITFLCISFFVSTRNYRTSPWHDLHWSSYSYDIRAGREVVVPINPPGWQIHFKAREAE